MENLMPKLRFVFDRRKKADNYKDKDAKQKAQVQLELYYRRTRHWYNTGVQIFAGQWNEKNWVINCTNAPQYNARLSAIMTRANNVVSRAVEERNFNIGVVEAIFKTEDSCLVVDEIDRDVKISKERNMSNTTINMDYAVRSSLQAFGKIQRIEDLTEANLEQYAGWLEQNSKLPWTIYNYQVRLNVICRRLVQEGKLKYNPFDNIKLRKPKDTNIRYLTEDELARIENVKLTTERDIYARDVFIFQSLTGMAFVDASSVHISDITKEDNRFVLRKSRHKTDVDFAILIVPQAYEILQRYGGQLNLYRNQEVNASLHVVGALAIGKKITTHMARHSFAVKALRYGIPIEYVSRMLGHTNIETTQKYAKVLSMDVLDQFEKMMQPRH